MKRICAVLLPLFIWPLRAHGEAAPDQWRGEAYYVLHGGVTVGLFGGSILTRAVLAEGSPGSDFTWFPGDLGVRQNHSPQAASISDVMLALTVAVPLAVELGQGAGPRLANASLIYAETLSEDLFLNTLVKYTVRRPRPYSYASEPNAKPKTAAELEDAQVSFYSGHSSTAFAAATSGSYLFAESAPNATSRCILWGTEFALAGATANFRVRAGKHYYSDIVVGAIIGTSLGISMPLLHGADYRPTSAEYLSAGGGLLLGVLVSQVLPLGVDAASTAGDLRWTIIPNADGTAGLRAIGQF